MMKIKIALFLSQIKIDMHRYTYMFLYFTEDSFVCENLVFPLLWSGRKKYNRQWTNIYIYLPMVLYKDFHNKNKCEKSIAVIKLALNITTYQKVVSMLRCKCISVWVSVRIYIHRYKYILSVTQSICRPIQHNKLRKTVKTNEP